MPNFGGSKTIFCHEFPLPFLVLLVPENFIQLLVHKFFKTNDTLCSRFQINFVVKHCVLICFGIQEAAHGESLQTGAWSNYDNSTLNKNFRVDLSFHLLEIK